MRGSGGDKVTKATESGIEGKTWFVEGGSRKQVTTRGHFDHLLDTYFPDHPGLFWREGMPLPEIPEWVLTGKGRPPDPRTQ